MANGPGQTLNDPVLPADPLEKDLDRVGTEPAGEDLAVVGQDLVGHPVAAHGVGEHPAHRPGRGPADQPGRDDEAGMVVEAVDQLHFGPVGEQDAAHDVELPQLHGPVPFPAHVVLALAASGLGIDQTVADQRPIHPRQRRQGLEAVPSQLVDDRGRPPAGVEPAQLADPHFDLGRHLMGTPRRPVGTVSQRFQAAVLIAPQPGMNALAGHPLALGHLDHLPAVPDHFHHGQVALLDHGELPEHSADLPARLRPKASLRIERPGEVSRISRTQRQASAEAVESVTRSHSVKDDPETHIAEFLGRSDRRSEMR